MILYHLNAVIVSKKQGMNGDASLIGQRVKEACKGRFTYQSGRLFAELHPEWQEKLVKLL